MAHIPHGAHARRTLIKDETGKVKLIFYVILPGSRAIYDQAPPSPLCSGFPVFASEVPAFELRPPAKGQYLWHQNDWTRRRGCIRYVFFIRRRVLYGWCACFAVGGRHLELSPALVALGSVAVMGNLEVHTSSKPAISDQDIVRCNRMAVKNK
jgi:hypothetical protein